MKNESNNDLVIELTDVSKVYHTYPTPRHRLMEILSRGRKRYSRETRALDGVSFSLKKGGRIGIVGENGSGKSTLLKILAGVLTPTTGKVKVNGRVSALLELGAGFNPELPGHENIRQFCMLHGMHQDEIEAAVPEIIKFSELRDAIDHPVKTYSSGMAVRLGFACAVYVQPDILIVDEALSVGDAYFQNKCLYKIRSMLDEGVSFIYVTHAADAVRSLCDEGLWLEKGKVRLAGEASVIGGAYQSAIFGRLVRAGYQDQPSDSESGPALSDTVPPERHTDSARMKAFAERVGPLRTGSGEIRVDDIVVVDEKGMETDSVGIDDQVRIRVFYHVKAPIEQRAVLNVGITDNSGKEILHFNPMFSGIYASDAPLNVPQMMEVTFRNQLCPGEFGVVAGIATLFENPRNHGQTLIDSVIDYCPGGSRFSVRFPDKATERDLWGLVHLDYQVYACSLD
jgi:lipopolysaccharide transport system ATP-binding protein